MTKKGTKSFRLRYDCCGRETCRTCRGQAFAHGPYWQERVEGGATLRWRRLGEARPTGVSAPRAAELRREAERDRAKREQAASAKRVRAARRPVSGRSAETMQAGALAAQLLRADFSCLELAWGATHDEVRRAFRRLSLRHHPDRPGGSHEAMQALNHAYRRVCDWLTVDGSPAPSGVVR